MPAGQEIISAAATRKGFYPYKVEYSLRMNDPDSPLLTREFTSQGTSTQKGTLSIWVKRGHLTEQTFLQLVTSATGADVDTFAVQFNSSDQIQVENQGGTLITNALYRDPSAWLHIVVAGDTTQSTASNRTKLWVNGEQITSFASADYPTLNASGYNLNGHDAHISESFAGSRYTDGYIAQAAFCDGQTYTASDFGEDINGVWVPKDITGLTYGTNGYLLDFSDNSTAAALGNDISGNNNDMTVSGITTTDQVTDTPTLNYPTLQVPFSTTSTTYSEGNLKARQDSAVYKHTRASFALPTTGKWYWEVQFIDARATDPPGTAFGIGVSDNDGESDTGYSTGAVFAVTPGSTTVTAYEDGAYTAADNITLSNAVQDGDWYGIAYDADTREMWLWSQRDAAWLDSGNPSGGTNPWKTLTALSSGKDYFPILLTQTNDATRWSEFGVNFGQQSFVGTAPTDFLQLNATNLPEPTLGPNSAENVTDYFKPVLYTGNGTAIGSGGNAVTGVGFQPDMVLVKNRDATDNWRWMDITNGTGKYWQMGDNGASAVITDSETLGSFDADGFTVGSEVGVNTNTEKYMAFCFKERSGFFDTKSYAGTGVTKTESHTLSAVPRLIVTKRVTNSNAAPCYLDAGHVSDPETDYIYCDLTNPRVDLNTMWNDTAPTSSVFTVGTATGINFSGDTHLAYLFANMDGMCKVGYYVANANADGPYIYTGFTPSFIIIKAVDLTQEWVVKDTARNPYNVANTSSQFNGNFAESTANDIDFLSNGFKIRVSGSGVNFTAGQNYIFIAFSSMPFKYSRAR